MVRLVAVSFIFMSLSCGSGGDSEYQSAIVKAHQDEPDEVVDE